MKRHTVFGSVIYLLIMFSCDDLSHEIVPQVYPDVTTNSKAKRASKVTGSLEVNWLTKGGRDGAQMKIGVVTFSAHGEVINESERTVKNAKGEFSLSIGNDANHISRTIEVKVLNVGFGPIGDNKSWIFGQVISDTKCEGNEQHSGCKDGDHIEGGCSGSEDHSDSGSGGCDHGDGDSHDATSCSGSHHAPDSANSADAEAGHDEGCNHEDVGTDSGGSGCSNDDSGSHDDGGCSHDDGTTGGGQDHAGKGKQCRVGKFIIVKMHDKGTPGIEDGIAWKWYGSLDGFSISNEPKKLCKKTIRSGNLVVHQY